MAEIKFETLKKSHKKQVIMGALAVCVIGGALTFATTKAKYKLTEDINIVTGTINYKVPDLRVVSIKTSEDGTNYTDADNVPTSGYTLNTTNSICKIGSTDTKDDNITIEYKDGKVNIKNASKKNTKCYLYFDKKTPETIPEIIAAVNPKTTTPDFSKTAKTDEGVYAVSDGMYGGTSYYWRGAVTNNYVKFANFCWRIVRINGDGTLRLIYDGTTCHANGTRTTESIAVTSQVYNTSADRSEYVGWTYSTGSQRTLSGTASNAKSQTDTWFSSNIIGTNATKVADGKYCNDREVASGYSWSSQPSSTFYYAGYERLNTNKTPTLNCASGDTYILKVGAITADEVAYAGGVYETGNINYYLYNDQYYWTMSPMEYMTNNTVPSFVFHVYSSGSLSGVNVNNTNPSVGVRPVINLKSDIKFQAGGDGTQTNPYVVS